MNMNCFVSNSQEDPMVVMEVYEMLNVENINELVFKFPNGTVITSLSVKDDVDIFQDFMADFFQDCDVINVQFTSEKVVIFYLGEDMPPSELADFWKKATSYEGEERVANELLDILS